MDALLTAIVTWLSINFGLPAIYDHPRIEVVASAQVSDMKYAEVSQPHRRHVVALYDDRERIIYVPNSWDGSSPADLSVLVHEMVHHLQNLAGGRYACLGAREEMAYAAQDQWLRLFGRSLSQDFELDSFTIKISALCYWP